MTTARFLDIDDVTNENLCRTIILHSLNRFRETNVRIIKGAIDRERATRSVEQAINVPYSARFALCEENRCLRGTLARFTRRPSRASALVAREFRRFLRRLQFAGQQVAGDKYSRRRAAKPERDRLKIARSVTAPGAKLHSRCAIAGIIVRSASCVQGRVAEREEGALHRRRTRAFPARHGLNFSRASGVAGSMFASAFPAHAREFTPRGAPPSLYAIGDPYNFQLLSRVTVRVSPTMSPRFPCFIAIYTRGL